MYIGVCVPIYYTVNKNLHHKLLKTRVGMISNVSFDYNKCVINSAVINSRSNNRFSLPFLKTPLLRTRWNVPVVSVIEGFH